MPGITCSEVAIPYHQYKYTEWHYLKQKEYEFIATVGFIVVPCDGVIDMTVECAGDRTNTPGEPYSYLWFLNGGKGWDDDDKGFASYKLKSNITKGYSAGDLVVVQTRRRNELATEKSFLHAALFKPNNPIATAPPHPAAAEAIPVGYQHVDVSNSIGQHRYSCSYVVKSTGKVRLRARLKCEPSNERSLAKLRVYLNEILIHHDRDYHFGHADLSYDKTIDFLAGVTVNVRFELEYENSRPDYYEAFADWVG